MRLLVALTVLTGCDLAPPVPDTGRVPACDLADEPRSCPECDDGPWTCTFEDVSVTTGACGGCQTKTALYEALCDAGNPASIGDIVGGTECHACRSIIDACTDPCTPVCVSTSEIPTETCTATCSGTIADPPGQCAWNGSECAWVE
jgi:hypothetical protein